MADVSAQLLGKVITLPDGPWAGVRVRLVAYGPVPGARLPLPYYTLRRLDTGQQGHRMALDVMLLAAQQGLFGSGAAKEAEP